MENIESTIVELGSIFQELAHMVKEQEEQIERFGSYWYIYKTSENLVLDEIMKVSDLSIWDKEVLSVLACP